MRLQVWHEGECVGLLSAAGRLLDFAYSPEWLLRPAAFPLSPRLPISTREHRGDEVLFFFANLLPEGAVLDTLCRLQRLPRGNVFRLLQAFGRECAGAFELLPEDASPGDHAAHYLPYDDAAIHADFADAQHDVPLLHRHGELRLSLAGAQNKLPVYMRDDALFLPAAGAASTHILKPALPLRYPHSVENEALCLRLAAAVGLPTANVSMRLLPVPMLLVERYDRRIEFGRVRRLHQLDFCQLSGVLPDQKYQADGGPGFAELFATVDTHSVLPARDRLQLVDWLLFNFLIGNADAHGKNAAMLYGDDGRLRLAPAYDLLATGYWGELSTKLAMDIGGEKRPAWVMARHWQRCCATANLNRAQFRRRATALAHSAVAALSTVANGLQIDENSAIYQHLSRTLMQRGEWIDQRLVAADA